MIEYEYQHAIDHLEGSAFEEETHAKRFTGKDEETLETVNAHLERARGYRLAASFLKEKLHYTDYLQDMWTALLKARRVMGSTYRETMDDISTIQEKLEKAGFL